MIDTKEERLVPRDEEHGRKALFQLRNNSLDHYMQFNCLTIRNFRFVPRLTFIMVTLWQLFLIMLFIFE